MQVQFRAKRLAGRYDISQQLRREENERRGGVMSVEIKDGYCNAIVYSPALRFPHPTQCSRRIWKDGYCKTHHPDSVAARRNAANERYEERYKNSPLYRLRQAEGRIKELEAEILALKKGGGAA
jgi:hypothetical protein